MQDESKPTEPSDESTPSAPTGGQSKPAWVIRIDYDGTHYSGIVFAVGPAYGDDEREGTILTPSAQLDAVMREAWRHIREG